MLRSRLYATECKNGSLGGDVDGIDDKVGELEVGEGSHVNARAATVGLGNLVQLRLKLSLRLWGGINHPAVGSSLLGSILLDLVHEEGLDGVGLGCRSHGRGVGAQAAPGKGDGGSAQGHHPYSLVEVNQAIKAWSLRQ